MGDLTEDGSGNCPRDLGAEGRFYAEGAFQTEAFKRTHPDCFVMNELFPGGFTPRFGGDTLGLLAVRRRTRRDARGSVLGRESGHRRERGGFLHQ